MQQARFDEQPHWRSFLQEMEMAYHWSDANFEVIPIQVGDAGLCLLHQAGTQIMSFGFVVLSSEIEQNQQLWREVKTEAVSLGSTQLKGPIQGTTYFPYRFVSESDGCSFFKGEYFSKLDEHDFMMVQLPKDVLYYRSGYRDHFDGIMSVSKPYYDQAVAEGLEIRLHQSVDRALFQDLVGLIDQIFGGNWSFQRLSPAALEQIFRQEFGKKQKMALHSFWFEEKMIGFCRYIQNDDDTIICKTLGLLPEYQKRGWGNASVYQMHADAKANEVKRMIYALIYDGNRVQQHMPKDDSIIFRKYASYVFEL